LDFEELGGGMKSLMVLSELLTPAENVKKINKNKRQVEVEIVVGVVVVVVQVFKSELCQYYLTSLKDTSSTTPDQNIHEQLDTLVSSSSLV
jgi:hypothetical protein